ncbi:MAG: ABC-2 transporter permease [Clostridia bacterium]|nr:ABC-2 transporter permease [Clostridia bacterium]
MIGLLTKDSALIFQRKRVIIALALWALAMCIALDDATFVVGWLTTINAFFAISSVTYDEYDNCYPFLMSLPVTRKTYVLEKYLFGFLCGMGAWVFSVVVCFGFALFKGSIAEPLEELIILSVFIPLFMLIVSLILPAAIKWGTEKGRIALFLGMALIVVVIMLAGKISSAAEGNGGFLSSFGGIAAFSVYQLIAGFFVITAVVTALSAVLSMRIMEKKEF